MRLCGSCDHPLVFHRANPPEDPCNLCPRGDCMVPGCACESYDGVPISRDNHQLHVASRVKWGGWGYVQFSTPAELTIAA